MNDAVLRTASRSLPLLLLAAGALAQSLPVAVEATVETTALADAGRAALRLRFAPETALDRALAVRVELRRGGRTVLRRDHAPPVPTREWRAAQVVEYELPLFFPLGLPELQRRGSAANDTGGEVEVWLGFFDAAADRTMPPLTRRGARDGLARVATFALPPSTGEPDATAVAATIAEATQLAKKEPQLAWDQLEFAFRRVADYALKKDLQQALLTVGRMPPAPLTFEEETIVEQRIRAERTRYLRQVAGRMFDRGRLHGALLLLDEVGGALQQDADRAVLGALADARRVTADREQIVDRIFALSDEQEAEVDAFAAKHTDPEKRLALAIPMAERKDQRAVARELVRRVAQMQRFRDEAEAALAKIDAAWLADVPPDQRAEADAARNHACWARTSRRASHRFVLIGPQQLVDGVPGDSLLRFDLAYLYLTDLFGRVPNPDGDRVTVYFKELWEFGGGIGGGKIIDVGNADPQAKALRVDGGLYYHELTHCIDDTRPIYDGLREGLADFGAAFAYHELGQVAAARAAFGAAQRAFLGDYLERDLEYWRIPNYGPSAGLLLHFVQTHGKEGNGYRWDRYRRFFRDYRSCPVDDARTPDIARAFAFHLVQAFGPAAFDDLVRFRWPLLPEDRDAVRLEQDAARVPSATGALANQPGSPVPRDRTARELRADDAALDDWAAGLGVVTDWWVIGPFKQDGVDPDTFRFPPELEIDLGRRYDSINNTPTWRRPGNKPVTVEPTGWLTFHFAYMDDSAIYALTHVTVEEATEAWFHLRADDDATLFVDDRLIGKYDHARGPLGPWRPDGRTLLPDAMRFAVALEPGRHKVLLKIRNRNGPSGCSLAIARRNGTPLPGWRTDVEPAAKKSVAIEMPDGARWPQRFRVRADQAGAHRKLDATVGEWRTRNRAIEGTSTDRQVEWRKYTVRPGFPKDSPSNLAWLPAKATDGLDAFSLTVDLAEGSPPPKLCVIFQGDGGRDALGGWTLILEPAGRDRVRARLERYDRLVYSSEVAPFGDGDGDGDGRNGKERRDGKARLELLYFDRRLVVRLGGRTLFDQASIRPIPGRHRIGLATWGEALRIAEIELRGPTRTR